MTVASDSQGRHKRRKLDEDEEDEVMEDSDDSDNSDMMIVARLRSRLYYEKSVVYRDLGDSRSQSAALKYSLRLHHNNVVSRIYCQQFSVSIDAPPDSPVQHLETDINNVCLRFMLDFDNINLWNSSNQLSSDL